MLLSHLLPLATILPSTLAWGSFGHRTVAYLAEKYLTRAGYAYVEAVLQEQGRYDISDAAIWADGSVKRRVPETAHWHYIDAQDDPPEHCEVKYKRDCNQNGVPGCVISAITNMTARVNNMDLVVQEQKEALMFLIHFIGDVHQPLHTESLDRGGNEINVHFKGHKTNLHSLWDTMIPTYYRGAPEHASHPDDRAREKEFAKAWANDLYDMNAKKGLDLESECHDISTAQACALKWASEANKYICSYVLKDGKDSLDDAEVGGDYYEGAAPIAEMLIGKGGLRLGGWINELAAQREEGRNLVEQIEL